MRFLLPFAVSLLAAFPVQAREAAAVPQNFSVVETAVATHSQHPEPPFGCFVKLQAENAGAILSPYWAYTEYDFICHLSPTEKLPFYAYRGIDECDTGEAGAYNCGLHGKAADGSPIDRPPVAVLAQKDMRAIPDLLNIVLKSDGITGRRYAAMLEEYANATDLPAAREAIAAHKDELLAAKQAAGDDAWKKNALISLLLTLGVDLPPAEAASVLDTYLGDLEPLQMRALEIITAHPDDPGIDPQKVMWFYVRNFADRPDNADPGRAAAVRTVSTLGQRLQPSVGLLLDRMRSAKDWPASLMAEASGIVCAAFRTDTDSGKKILITDDYDYTGRISCP